MITTLVIGVSLGVVYAMIALGFSVVFRTTGVVNFAQGSYAMIGGLGAAWTATTFHWPTALAIVVGVGFAGLCGAVLGAGVIVPLWRGGIQPLVVIVATFVFSLMVGDVALSLFGSQPLSLSPLPGPSLRVGQATIIGQYLWLVVVTALVAAATIYFLRRTWTGSLMEAVAEDRFAAALLGVSPYRQAFWAVVLTALLGGLAGALVAPVQYTSYSLGLDYSIMGFMAAVLGGLGSVEGGMLGGLVVGIITALVTVYVSSRYEEALAMLALFLLILLRPRGLFRTGARRSGV